MASAISPCPATSRTSRAISWRRAGSSGWPWGLERSSMSVHCFARVHLHHVANSNPGPRRTAACSGTTPQVVIELGRAPLATLCSDPRGPPSAMTSGNVVAEISRQRLPPIVRSGGVGGPETHRSRSRVQSGNRAFEGSTGTCRDSLRSPTTSTAARRLGCAHRFDAAFVPRRWSACRVPKTIASSTRVSPSGSYETSRTSLGRFVFGSPRPH